MMSLENYCDLIVNVCGNSVDCEVERSSIQGLQRKSRVVLEIDEGKVIVGGLEFSLTEISRSKGSKDVLYFYIDKGELALRSPKFVEVADHSLLMDKLVQ